MNIIINSIREILDSVNNSEVREHSNGWSVKEVVGHLIDSASNNHQRFIRYSENGNTSFPGYNPNECVSRAQYHQYNYESLVSLWYLYNEIIAQIITNIPKQALEKSISIGGDQPVTMKFLVEDYYHHMEKHKQQLLRILG